MVHEYNSKYSASLTVGANGPEKPLFKINQNYDTQQANNYND